MSLGALTIDFLDFPAVDIDRFFNATLVALGLREISYCPIARDFCFVPAECCIPDL